MPNLIEQRVDLARRGQSPFVICRMKSGWLMIGDVQPVDGYCLLLADPVAERLNALDEAQRAQYSLDTIRAGDALLAVTDAYRINYETLGNSWRTSRTFASVRDALFVERMREQLVRCVL